MATGIKGLSASDRQLDARPDALDFPDRMFVPTLTELPTEFLSRSTSVIDR